MEGLIAADQAATLWIAQHHNMLLDALLMPVAWAGEVAVGWVVAMLLLLAFGGRRERLLTVVFACGLVATELLLMPLFREWWPRPRPYMYLPDVRQMGVRWTSSSFPSAHMHLWVAGALLYGAAYRQWRWPLTLLTLLTAYSRPYAGMHHALDVLFGSAVGAAVGLLELAVAGRLGLGSRPTLAEQGNQPGDSSAVADEERAGGGPPNPQS
jgi:undecaprenyl-diphosphatase